MRRSIKYLVFCLVPLASCGLVLGVSSCTARDAPTLAQGTNTITGHARVVYSKSNYVRDCAGRYVYLVPVTPTSSAKMVDAFKNPEGGYVTGRMLGDFLDDADEAQIRKSECNTEAKFRFDSIPDGRYFVFARMSWLIGHGQNAVNLMSTVSVTNGETKDVDLEKVL